MRRLIQPRRLALTFLFGLVLLLADNLYWLVRNQTQLPCEKRLCVSPRSIEAVARKSSNPQIAALATWYFLSRRIPHARLAVPFWMATQKWNMEHLARLRVEVSDRPFIVDAQYVPQLRSTSTEHRAVALRHRRRVARDLYLRIDSETSDFVLAETNKADGPIFVMPRSEYAGVAAR